MKQLIVLVSLSVMISNCKNRDVASIELELSNVVSVDEAPFVWDAANLYFLLTDRFNNGDPLNDINFDRTEETAVLRGFEGGDLKGITQKIKEGYW